MGIDIYVDGVDLIVGRFTVESNYGDEAIFWSDLMSKIVDGSGYFTECLCVFV